jgi:hypothetical protein
LGSGLVTGLVEGMQATLSWLGVLKVRAYHPNPPNFRWVRNLQLDGRCSAMKGSTVCVVVH